MRLSESDSKASEYFSTDVINGSCSFIKDLSMILSQKQHLTYGDAQYCILLKLLY